MSRRYSFWTVTLFGGALLLDIAVHVLRPPVGFSGSDYIEPILGVVSIVAIWYAYSRLLQELNRLGGQVEAPALDRLSQFAFMMALFGYMLLPLPLVLIHHP